MRSRFRTLENEPVDRYLVMVPDTRDERVFCRKLMAFFHDHGR